jgi:hypothetical protein
MTKSDIWKTVLGICLGLIITLGGYGFSSLEGRVAKLETAPERLAAVETELRLLREEVRLMREDIRGLVRR